MSSEDIDSPVKLGEGPSYGDKSATNSIKRRLFDDNETTKGTKKGKSVGLKKEKI